MIHNIDTKNYNMVYIETSYKSIMDIMILLMITSFTSSIFVVKKHQLNDDESQTIFLEGFLPTTKWHVLE